LLHISILVKVLEGSGGFGRLNHQLNLILSFRPREESVPTGWKSSEGFSRLNHQLKI